MNHTSSSIEDYCPSTTGIGLLERRGMGVKEFVIFINTIILFVMFIGFRFIGLIALLLRVRFMK